MARFYQSRWDFFTSLVNDYWFLSFPSMITRKEEELVKRQTIERRALPKRIRAERKARDMMFRESLRISMTTDPELEREKLKKVMKRCDFF